MRFLPRILLPLTLLAGLVWASAAHAAFTAPEENWPLYLKGTAVGGGVADVVVRWLPGAFDPPMAGDYQELSGTLLNSSLTTSVKVAAGATSGTLRLTDSAVYSIKVAVCRSGICSLSIASSRYVDATPPSGSVEIDGGAAATNSRDVTLSLAATDPPIPRFLGGPDNGVAQYALDADGDGVLPCPLFFDPAADQSGCAGAFAPTAPATLTPGDGLKTVGVVFGDTALVPDVPCHPAPGVFCAVLLTNPMITGNASAEAKDTIILDTAKPIARSSQSRLTVGRGGAVSFDAGPSVDQNPGTGAGVDLATAAWDFSDGTPAAAGQAVTHAFPSVGTFIGSLRVSDRAGNRSDPQPFTVTVTPPPADTAGGGGTVGAVTAGAGAAAFRIDRVRVAARYRRSRLTGSIALTGSSTRAGPLTLLIRPAKGTAVRVAATVPAGAFTTTIRLPATLLPGRYGLELAGPGGSLSSSLTLIAPREGVVRSARLRASGGRARALFMLASKPSAVLRRRMLVVWSQGGRALGRVRVAASAAIGAALPRGAVLTRGTLTAQLRAGSIVVRSVSARSAAPSDARA